jgi:hypothetical protein
LTAKAYIGFAWVDRCRSTEETGCARTSNGGTSSSWEPRFPAKTFSSRERILAQGQRLEKLTVGVYIDGVTNAADPGTARCWRGC